MAYPTLRRPDVTRLIGEGRIDPMTKMAISTTASVNPDDTPTTSSDAGPLAGSVAIVTGCSAGIGKAIGIRLGGLGARLYALGRNKAALEEAIAGLPTDSQAEACAVDLTVDSEIAKLHARLQIEAGRVDILVHSAGVIDHSPLADGEVAAFDRQYQSNLRAPYVLTKALLPMLKAAQGEIVFINSSLGLDASRPDVGQFAATQHGLKAVADSLRKEVNADGVRVQTIYCGRTATPRQERLYTLRGADYTPDRLLQPEDIAQTVAATITLPRTAEVTDLAIRPMMKP